MSLDVIYFSIATKKYLNLREIDHVAHTYLIEVVHGNDIGFSLPSNSVVGDLVMLIMSVNDNCVK